MRGCELHGRDNWEEIQYRELGGTKTVKEVEAYGKVFWERYRELEGQFMCSLHYDRGDFELRVELTGIAPCAGLAFGRIDWEKIIQKIEAAEQGRQKNDQLSELVRKKVNGVEHPLQALKIAYANQTKGKSYSDEEDRYLLVELAKYGVGKDDTADRIKADINASPLFLFVSAGAFFVTSLFNVHADIGIGAGLVPQVTHATRDWPSLHNSSWPRRQGSGHHD